MDAAGKMANALQDGGVDKVCSAYISVTIPNRK
jgi:hypothetical protein